MYVCIIIYVYMVNRTYLSLYVQIYEETPRELLEMPETSSRALPKMARVTIQEDTKSFEVTPKCLLLEPRRDREEPTFAEAVTSMRVASESTSQSAALMQHLHFENSALQEESKGLVCVCVCVCVCMCVCVAEL
jgi:hypothetical protein